MFDSEATFVSAVVLTMMILLAAAVVVDLRSHRIPNILLAPALSVALLFNTMYGGAEGLLLATGGLFLGILMFLPLYAIGGMGAGDVKLLGVVGSFLGPWGALLAGLSAMMAGAVFGIVAIIWRRIRPSLEFRATQILSPGAHTMHAQEHDAPARRRVTQIAYAPAIATGAIVALWYVGYLPESLFG